VTTKQNKTLNYLLSATGMIGQKSNLVLGATDGRSESRADLTDAEADLLIEGLKKMPAKQDAQNEACIKMRRKLIASAREMGYYKPAADGTKKYVADMDRINGWVEKYGYLKKPFNDYTYEELPKLLSQFDTVLNKYLKSI